MKILVIGSGGREHSIIMKLSQSAHVEKIYAAPGNDGVAKHAICVPIDEMDTDRMIEFARQKAIDLTIVGPEAPLNHGIANQFQAAGIKAFAPNQEAAYLEGSKDFAKNFMKKYRIPTAASETFTDPEQAKAYIISHGAPIVIKADGLAQGKGVVVAFTTEEAIEAVHQMLVDQAFQEAGAKVVIEDFLEGEEFSLMAFVHEKNVYPMLTARDYKRAFDNGVGPNTGGMGAFAPVPDITENHIEFATEQILQKTADGMMNEGRPFTGILYAGLIMTEDGPKVIEFNTRFGDPETQVVLPLLENDLEQVMIDVLAGRDPKLKWKAGKSCVGVVLASTGYPEAYEKGAAIPEIQPSANTFVAYAGAKQKDNALVSNGGRVLLVGSMEDSLQSACEIVYETLARIDNDDSFFYRSDIGKML